jgi:hypothetical protein
MRRTACLSFAWFTVAIGIAQAAPARPLYEPPEPPKEITFFDLRGTAWKGPEAADRYIQFNADGTLSYHVGGKGGNATWKQEGNRVYFEINNGYREFRGTINFAGNAIQGDSWNKAGKRWQTILSPSK